MSVQIDKIRLDGGTQSRAAINEATEFPLSVGELVSSSWRGFTFCNDGVVTALITASHQLPGAFMVRVCGATASECIKPIPAELVGEYVSEFLAAHGTTASKLRWQACEELPIDTPKETSGKDGIVIYFLSAGPFIKIGKATGRADTRVSQLQTGCPYKIEILGAIPGSYPLEARLHRKFRHLHAHGEWFRDEPDLRAHIESLFAEAAQ